MESREKIMTIIFYLVFAFCVIIEVVFLFIVPYYYYSLSLQILKIIRILLGIIIILIDLYFLVAKFVQYLIKKEEKDIKNYIISYTYTILDKILIIVASIISLFILIYNITGIIICSKKYLKKKDTSFMANSLYVDSLYLLIENLLLSFCWLYFFSFWIYIFRESKKIRIDIKDENNIVGPKTNAAPGPSKNQIPSSERKIN